MGKKNKEPIVKRLFRTYILLIGLCVLVLLTGMLLYSGYLINRNIMQTQRQLSLSINQNIENYFREMNDFSMSLVKNEAFREGVLKGLPEAYHEGRSTVGVFSGLYQEAHEMIQKKYSIGIITGQDDYIWMGNEYFIGEAGQEIPGIYQDYAMDGSPVVKYLGRNKYLQNSMGERRVSGADSAKVVLARSFGKGNILYNGDAVLEIQVDAEEFADAIRRLSIGKNGTGFRISILNTEGEEIFSETDWDGKVFLEANGWEAGRFRKDGSYTYVYKIFDSGLYVLYNISISDYYSRLSFFVAVVLAFFLLVLAAMVVVNYQTARQISKPIHQMCEELGKVNLEHGIRYQSVDTDIRELDYLSDSIENLTLELEESMKRIIQLKEFEVHSKMLALQVQMQPHFLVNTLMTMGAMAEEAGNREIFQMCMNLTRMFRYISSDEKAGVKLFEEIRHVERYVEIMKERFPNAQVEIDIPLDMMNVKVPKLVLQTLVENSFKYSNRSKPYIWVKGMLGKDGRWSIQVSDNGGGFTEEMAAGILEKCKESMEGTESFSAKVGGMGLVNVYVRMRLFYGDDIVYRLGREGITIGGRE
ncbi:MAG: histidine kinase [Lachnospiraceae bacterium]|nr:histidine kinase [Lachnospiraceae bacterium]